MSEKTAIFLKFTGDKALARKLESLDKKMESRGATSAVNKGLNVVKKSIQKEAVGEFGKSMKSAIGARHKKNKRKGITEAKAGINVGSAGKKVGRRITDHSVTGSNRRDRYHAREGDTVTGRTGNKYTKGRFAKQARHAHLLALGTQHRFRKKIGGKFSYIRNPTPMQLRTGRIDGNDFVTRGASMAKSDARDAMVQSVRQFLEKNGARVS